MFLHERIVRFHEADAAGLVFFPCFFSYAHEAMEELMASADGGYAGLIMTRRVGLPAVRVDANFEAPLRYGDTARIEVHVSRIGTRSFELTYRFKRASDGVSCATLRHTVVATDLQRVKSMDVPADVRRIIDAHYSPDAD
ncbi:MAG: acyl-CoA thioesterase [Polyangiaceae bacterium]